MIQCFNWYLNPTHIDDDVILSKELQVIQIVWLTFKYKVINPKPNEIMIRGPIICLKWPIISI